ncbi:MAG TPA: hypothetical protein VKT00_10875, partial [Casimicrobiaceae bacterium]|nr:hypothetical protein [Casimicrobiaceae bacterium]
HYMDEAIFCDRLALMHAGHIVVESTPGDLLERGRDTPMLEIESTRNALALRLLTHNPSVLEAVPYAGRLRIRLRPGGDVDAVARQIIADAAASGIAIDRVAPTTAQFEDVVVALLDETGAAR